MLKTLSDFDNQLTKWVCIPEKLDFAVRQLQQYGDTENQNYIIKEKNGKYAVFINVRAICEINPAPGRR